MKLNKENREKCRKIIKLNGEKPQLLVSMEEGGEFIQAISKYLRYGDTEPLYEEYTDMVVMMEQIRQMFGIKRKEINKRAAKKLFRVLEGRVLYADMESDS